MTFATPAASTLAAIRHSPHAVDARRLNMANIDRLLAAGLIKKHRDNNNLVFTVKAHRGMIDALVHALTPEELKAAPVDLTVQQKLFLKLLRTFAHGVSPRDIAAVRTSLIKAGYIKRDKRDGSDIKPPRRRYFTLKSKRAEIDGLSLS